MTSIISVGIDIGTTSTHLVVSCLHVSSVSSLQQVPHLQIDEREIIHRGQVCLTPLCSDGRIDATGVSAIVANEYRSFGIEPAQVDTGALIITGESARLKNAADVAMALSSYAGNFVVASAGPHLESILAARGSGAFDASKKDGSTICNVDIGGGTVNAAVIQSGKLIDTACLGIGGRCLRFDAEGALIFATDSAERMFGSEVLGTLLAARPVCSEQLFHYGRLLADAAFAFLFPVANYAVNAPAIEPLLLTEPLRHDYRIDRLWITGGVAELMRSTWLQEASLDAPLKRLLPFDDLGLLFAFCLAEKLQAQATDYFVPDMPIRSTAIGAGLHTLRLSGATVDAQIDDLPIKNVPLIRISLPPRPSCCDLEEILYAATTLELKRHDLDWRLDIVALVLDSLPGLSYADLKSIARALAEVVRRFDAVSPIVIVLLDDVAAALGLLMRRELGNSSVIVIDGIESLEGDYIDIGSPLTISLKGHTSFSLPVVIKSLLFS